MLDKVKDFVQDISWKWFLAIILIPIIFGVYNDKHILSVTGIALRRGAFAFLEQMGLPAKEVTKTITGGKDGDIKQDDFYLPKEEKTN
jgi:hypothetical protein